MITQQKTKMSLEHFYTLEHLKNIDENNYLAKIKLNEEHPVYQGHFPQQAVVPGVLQLNMIQELTEQVVKQKLMLRKVTNVKYLNIMTPEMQNITLEVNHQIKEQDIKVKAVLKNEEIIFTKVSAIFTPL